MFIEGQRQILTERQRVLVFGMDTGADQLKYSLMQVNPGRSNGVLRDFNMPK